jgi:hypothetical protein
MKTIESIFKILAVILTIMLVSCEELTELPIDENESKTLVVDGMITNDTMPQVVNLSLTGSFYMDDKAPRATGADVIISDNQGNEFPLYETIPGKYVTKTSIAGTIGNTYTLTINYEGETYFAQSTMPRMAEIDSLSYRWDSFMESYRVLLFGQEPKGKGDSYMWQLNRNGELLTTDISQMMIIRDDFVDGNYIKGLEVDFWEMEYNIQTGDTITVTQYSISKHAIDFFTGVLAEYNSGQAAMRPPANVASNISNGAIGLFHAASISRKTIVIE